MVKAYHALLASDVDQVEDDDLRGVEDEGRALLGSSASRIGLVKGEAQREGHATLTSSIGNLANTIIGSGACAASPPLSLLFLTSGFL